MSTAEEIKRQIAEEGNEDKAVFLSHFFQAYEGGYGDGDRFIGVTVPNLRKVAKRVYKDTTLEEVEKVLQEPFHEYRLVALIILVYQFEKAKNDEEKAEIVEIYLKNIEFINNWDLVDSSADKILGPYYFSKNKTVLYDFAHSSNVWKQRIAIIATFYFIKKGHFEDTLEIAKILLHHKHDLIHKAVGWMLREVGNRDFKVEFDFLKDHYNKMPRTMLRYAIEKFDPELRQRLLKGLI